jgi:hypothetical protein
MTAIDAGRRADASEPLMEWTGADEDGAPAPVRRRFPSWRPSEATWVFLAAFVGYLFVAAFLLRHNIIYADALSRVGNAFYVLYSRDPHLPAVGFVWNPLPSLALLPMLPLRAVFPDLVTHGAAGNIQSAACMAVSVALMAVCLRKLGVRTLPRLALTAVFAVQPMIALYAGSGLSEAMLLMFMVLATSALLDWIAAGDPGRLVIAGLALGLAYLTRYEAVAPAAAVVLLVFVVSYRRGAGTSGAKLRGALADAVLVGAPFTLAFALWALMSRIIVGQWFATFSSQYGNSAQVSSGRESIESITGASTGASLEYVGRQLVGLAPAALALAVVAAVVAVRRRDLRAAAGPTVLGAVLLFDDLTTLIGGSFGWLRFQIAAIPLSVLLAGSIIAGMRDLGGSVLRTGARMGAVGLVMTAALVAIPSQAVILTTSSNGLAREESPALRSVFLPELASTEDKKSLRIFETERSIADYIASLDSGEGTVITDTAYAYSVILAASTADPRQFVITSDLDFDDAVADPRSHGITYMLVPSPNLGPADALGKQWPGLYDDGGGIGVLVKEWTGAFYGDWRLYRVR